MAVATGGRKLFSSSAFTYFPLTETPHKAGVVFLEFRLVSMWPCGIYTCSFTQTNTCYRQFLII